MKPEIQPTPVLPSAPSRRLPWLPILLIIFSLTLISSLLYQNISLKNQLSLLKTASPSQSQPISQISPSSTPDPTANWKTYKDELYGFEFKYLETDPAKQYLDNDLTMGYRLLLLRNVLKKQYFAIKIQKVDKNMSLLDYWKFESDIAKSGLIFSNCNPNQCFGAYKSWTKQAVFNLSNGEVGGKKALFIDNPMPGEYQNTIVLRLTNNYVLEIKKSNEPISDQILSTFKFLDPDKIFCGGIMGAECPSGSTCRLDGSYPDASGVCVKN